MKVAVIGTGYVGLVAGACFSDTGNDVLCVDQDKAKIDALKSGIIPIYEPGLDDIVKRNIAEKRLTFTTSTAEAVKACEVIFMAVGTPPLPNGEPDLRFLQSASEEVGKAMDGYRMIVNKSTVPIGSHQVVAEWISKHTKHPVDVVSNPEFLKEGTAVEDFLKPDRVVIGTKSEAAFKKMAELYAPFVRQGNPVLWMDPVSAEMTKYACNSFLATRISFMNELSILCEKVGADIEEVRKGMSTDVRIGKHFLYAGAGYGGSCFPKDIEALLTTAERNGVLLSIIDSAQNANTRQKRVLVEKTKRHFGKDLSGKTIAIWGLAFKPNTDDLREAPALVVIEELLKSGAKVQAFDPVAMPKARPMIEKLQNSANARLCESSYAACEGADALLLITEWNEFRQPDFKKVLKLLNQPVLFDGRNLFSPAAMRELGFQYQGIGRR